MKAEDVRTAKSRIRSRLLESEYSEPLLYERGEDDVDLEGLIIEMSRIAMNLGRIFVAVPSLSIAIAVVDGHDPDWPSAGSDAGVGQSIALFLSS